VLIEARLPRVVVLELVANKYNWHRRSTLLPWLAAAPRELPTLTERLCPVNATRSTLVFRRHGSSLTPAWG
jgi:hypothetical protein